MPANAPTTVAPESESRARRNRGNLPSSPRRLARVATPIRVPAVSNISTINIDKIGVTMESCRAPTISSCRNTGAIEGGIDTKPLNSVSPKVQPRKVANSMPMSTAPVIFLADSATMTTKPRIQTSGSKLDKSPNATSVAGSVTTMPAFFNAMKPRNKPIPAAIPNFRLRGIALTSHSRTGNRLSATKIIPDTNTAPRAVCHAWPIPRTILKVKNAF